jgi:hypothetical protein
MESGISFSAKVFPVLGKYSSINESQETWNLRWRKMPHSLAGSGARARIRLGAGLGA